MLGYRPQLDSLRAFAVTTVLLAHFWLPDLALSSLGVRLFFVLSGYLLTRILLSERSEAELEGIPRSRLLKDFYVRRILRIWPAYFAALAAAVLAGASEIEETFAWHALFASNILFFLEQQWYPPLAAHLWTLSVEEQFYLVLPLLILFMPPRLLRPTLVACIAAAVIYRAAVSLTVEGTVDFYFLLPIAQLDALGGGALLALIRHESGSIDHENLLRWSLPPALLLFLLPLPSGFDFSVTQAAVVVPMAALVAWADAGIGGRFGAILGSRPIVGLGRISYGVYLYHMFVAAAVYGIAGRFGYAPFSGPLAFILFFLLTILVSAASWRAVEEPALSLRRYFRQPSKASLIPAAPQPTKARPHAYS